MKTVGYCRVSTQEQVEGTSLAAQAEQIRAYASMKGLELVDVLVDAGISGGKPLAIRPEGGKLVDLIDSGEVQAVIISKLDRGFRSASDCLNNVESWERRKVSLHILSLSGTTIDTSTPTGKFFIAIMAGAAELERNLIRERCNEGRKARRAEGKRLGTVPFGWNLGPDMKSLIHNPNEQEAIRLARCLNQAGHSLRSIARELTERGIAAKKNGSWTHRQVANLLRREA